MYRKILPAWRYPLGLLENAIGSRYTYSPVPYADWWQALGGAPLEGRNHYDRVVHFLYGYMACS